MAEAPRKQCREPNTAERKAVPIKRHRTFWIAAAALAAALCAAFVAVAWWQGCFLARWQEKQARWDCDADGAEEQLLLSGQTLTLSKAKTVLWQTDPAWRVEDFLLGDIDRDGVEELLLLVWKRGSYGSARPFWVQQKEEERGFSQHIFIYRWKEGLQPVWMSSRLRPGVLQWEMQKSGTIAILTTQQEETVWGWRTWGLERLDGEKTPF